MKQFVAEVAEGVSIADVIQREHVKRPINDVLPESATQSGLISCFISTAMIWRIGGR